MGYLACDFMGSHTSYWCDAEGCPCTPGKNGSITEWMKSTPRQSIDWLHARGWEVVGNSLYCATHVAHGIQVYANQLRASRRWEAERDARKLLDAEIRRLGAVSEEARAEVQALYERAEILAADDARREEEARTSIHARRAEAVARKTQVDAVLAGVRR